MRPGASVAIAHRPAATNGAISDAKDADVTETANGGAVMIAVQEIVDLATTAHAREGRARGHPVPDHLAPDHLAPDHLALDHPVPDRPAMTVAVAATSSPGTLRVTLRAMTAPRAPSHVARGPTSDSPKSMSSS